ncbi:MAG: hemerythrin family protein [Candidatus Sedimenticola sp. 20ELBAFRAG]
MPEFMQFNTRIALGIDELDNEHKALVNLLNRLAGAIQTNPKPPLEEATEMLAELAMETKDHFRNEEACMERSSYPDLHEHHREHVMLCAELKLLMRELQDGSEQLDMDLLVQLKQWLIGHIVTADREFANFYHRSIS